MKINLTHGIVCKRCLCCGFTHKKKRKSEILLDVLYRKKLKLFEDYDDNGFIYERGSIILKGYLF